MTYPLRHQCHTISYFMMLTFRRPGSGPLIPIYLTNHVPYSQSHTTPTTVEVIPPCRILHTPFKPPSHVHSTPYSSSTTLIYSASYYYITATVPLIHLTTLRQLISLLTHLYIGTLRHQSQYQSAAIIDNHNHWGQSKTSHQCRKVVDIFSKIYNFWGLPQNTSFFVAPRTR